MREAVTTLLDAAGLVLVAFGLGAMATGGFLFGWHDTAGPRVLAGGVGALTMGVAIVAGSMFADRRAAAARAPVVGDEVP